MTNGFLLISLGLNCRFRANPFLSIQTLSSCYFSSSGDDNVYFSLIQVLTEHAKYFNIRQRFEQLYSYSSSGLIINESTSEAI